MGGGRRSDATGERTGNEGFTAAGAAGALDPRSSVRTSTFSAVACREKNSSCESSSAPTCGLKVSSRMRRALSASAGSVSAQYSAVLTTRQQLSTSAHALATSSGTSYVSPGRAPGAGGRAFGSRASRLDAYCENDSLTSLNSENSVLPRLSSEQRAMELRDWKKSWVEERRMGAPDAPTLPEELLLEEEELLPLALCSSAAAEATTESI